MIQSMKFLAILCALASAGIMSFCNSAIEASVQEEDLVGLWNTRSVQAKGTLTFGSLEKKIDETVDAAASGSYFRFYSDNTYRGHIDPELMSAIVDSVVSGVGLGSLGGLGDLGGLESGEIDFSVFPESDTGTWSLSNSELTLNSLADTTIVTTMKLDGNKLNVTIPVDLENSIDLFSGIPVLEKRAGTRISFATDIDAIFSFTR